MMTQMQYKYYSDGGDIDKMDSRYVSFTLGGQLFEYDENKNKENIKKHGISFKTAARVFFDYDRIEDMDTDNGTFEIRFDVIGDVSAGAAALSEKIGSLIGNNGRDDILFVVYTERIRKTINDSEIEVIRMISARYATDFERGLYYGRFGG